MDEADDGSEQQALFSAPSRQSDDSNSSEPFEDAQEDLDLAIDIRLNADAVSVSRERGVPLAPEGVNAAGETASGSTRRFDESIPMTHRYLGNDMTDVYGRVIIDEGDTIRMPLYCDPSIILVPNQVVPLQFFHPRLVAMVRYISERQKTFVFYCEKVGRIAKDQKIGTTAELMSVNIQNEEAESSIKLLVVGRQRVYIRNITHQTDGMVMVTTKLLRDVELGDALDPVLPHKLRPDFSSLQSSQGKRKIRHNDGSMVTVWPSFLLQRFTKANLMNTIKGRLEGIWGTTYKAGLSMSDPNKFSYWLTTNLPLTDRQKVHLLTISSDMERLNHISHVLNMNYTRIICDQCMEVIAQAKDMFSMSVAGPSGAYVNPHGCVHELITVHEAQAVSLFGNSSTEYSWFPGYAWTIIHCSNCIDHLGWKFTAGEPGLIPSEFYGLSRRSVHAITNEDVRQGELMNLDSDEDINGEPLII